MGIVENETMQELLRDKMRQNSDCDCDWFNVNEEEEEIEDGFRCLDWATSATNY